MKCIRCFREIPEGSAFCSHCGKRQGAVPAAEKKTRRRAKGTGSIYKMAGNRSKPWAVTRDRKFLGSYATKSEAQIALERLSAKNIGEAYGYTVQQVYDCWRAEHFPTLSKKGQEMYRNAWNRMSALATRKMRDVRTADYQGIINAMEDAGLSASSANKIKQLAGQLSKWAMREDIISTNYAQFIRIYDDDAQERAPFMDEEVALLKQHDHIESAKIVLLLIYTGLRIGELFKLPRRDIHLEEGYFVGGSKTNAGKGRTVPILDEARPYLEYFMDKNAGPRLVDSYEGNRSAGNFRNRDYAKLLESLKITGKTPHSARHTFASLAVRAGVKPEVLQEIIGHASYSTTIDIYTHVNLDEIQTEAAKISALK